MMEDLLKLLPMLNLPGVTRVFAEDDGDDDKSGGAGDDDKSADDGKRNDDDQGTVTIVVDGNEVALTPEELKEKAQLGYASTKKFQEASEMRKAAEKGIRIGSLMEKVTAKEANAAEIAELSGLLQMAPGDLEKVMNPTKSTPEKDKKVDKDRDRKLTLEDLDPELQQLLADTTGKVQERELEETRRQIEENTKKAVDSDEILGKMIIDEDVSEDTKEVIQGMAFEEVQRRILLQEEYGTQLLDKAVKTVRSRVKKLGILNRGSQYPIPTGLTPTGSLPSDIQADKPIKRVSSTDDDYEDNAIKRIQQMTLKAFQRKKK